MNKPVLGLLLLLAISTLDVQANPTPCESVLVSLKPQLSKIAQKEKGTKDVDLLTSLKDMMTKTEVMELCFKGKNADSERQTFGKVFGTDCLGGMRMALLNIWMTEDYLTEQTTPAEKMAFANDIRVTLKKLIEAKCFAGAVEVKKGESATKSSPRPKLGFRRARRD